ncbi:MAG: hypothetical protein OEY18_12025 [Candidatus Aminicenantes bacterium]|nr:hypothetical protein [Candidatus Aminicenantes bacterium]MDH5385427.1 hypothetical protein [Candidatus Aminicenantes bacterium]MDH5744040.1 hypothetical protein [Candidatus Aminicenantes bacterium]
MPEEGVEPTPESPQKSMSQIMELEFNPGPGFCMLEIRPDSLEGIVRTEAKILKEANSVISEDRFAVMFIFCP